MHEVEQQAESCCAAEEFDSCACTGRNLSKLVSPTVLALLARGDAHGYLLAKEIERHYSFPGAAPNHSSVYRMLADMQEQDLIEQRLETSGTGPVRRMYRITPKGLKCLEQWVDSLRQYRSAIDHFLNVAGD